MAKLNKEIKMTPDELLEEIQGIKDEKLKDYAMGNYCVVLRNRMKKIIEERVEGLKTISPNKIKNEVNEIMEMADKVDKLNEIIKNVYGGDIDE